MSRQKKSRHSRYVSYAVLMIGTVSLACVLVFTRTKEKFHAAANAEATNCHTTLVMCMKKTADVQPECKACAKLSGEANTTTMCQSCAEAKAKCQTTYSQCSDPNEKIHTWQKTR